MKPVVSNLKQALAGATLLSIGLGLPVWAQEQPAAVQQILSRGVSIEGSFDAPGGMTGYVGRLQGSSIAFYLTADKEHVIIGPMLDADGRNLTEPRIQELVVGPQNNEAWKQLEDAEWVRDGNADAPVILYAFTDPNCPYCHRFRQSSEPWINAGLVQIRHVMVGILKEDSLPKAATILGSEDPQAALLENQNKYDTGGITVNAEIVDTSTTHVEANNQLMSELGLNATPSIYYSDSNGRIQIKQGAPRPEEMPDIMGSEEP